MKKAHIRVLADIGLNIFIDDDDSVRQDHKDGSTLPSERVASVGQDAMGQQAKRTVASTNSRQSFFNFKSWLARPIQAFGIWTAAVSMLVASGRAASRIHC